MIGLGIETSCDETSISVVEDGRRILSCVVYSQIQEHAKYGGVVPEIASRAHLEKINAVFAEAMAVARVKPGDLGYCAVTNRPGLTGSLMIGGMFAQCLNLTHSVPLVTIDHLEAHFYAVVLNEGEGEFEFPFLGLLLSGGNSALFVVRGPEQMEKIADTLDDACGEAFDKTAAILGLGYPGGPLVEKAALSFTSNEPSIFAPLLRDEKNLAFSFSGIKTAVIRAKQNGHQNERICRDFQNTAFELVERMLLRAIEQTGLRRVVASGGVLANSTLRNRLTKVASDRKIALRIPGTKLLCTDNGAMVAAAGYFLFKAGKKDVVGFAVSDRR
ncbi:MAG: tRNA (adenosine(37)-N6)-threonylcarbamoyltransferase complex transferase subunit TsaD [Leptospirales bacterium]|nr:tRNA (adenosine(37)-N6)-threonylcarbamoyltransferase complex transferase subunit TsaD [Leptospirales bacterium]